MLENTFSKKYVKFCCIVIFLCFLLLLGCDKENEEEFPVASYPIKTANIEGKVIGSGGYSNLANSNIYGADVNLNEINTDGLVHTSLQPKCYYRC